MNSSRKKFLIFNILGLQFTWAACAYGAVNSMSYLGMYVGLTYITLHLILTKNRLLDLLILLIIGSLGITLNALNTHFGVISFVENSGKHLLIPYWLMTLWFVFSLLIPHIFHWVPKKIAFSFVIGALGGSYSYWMGHQLGALQLAEPLYYSLGIYFLQWGLIFSAGLALTHFFRGTRNESISNNTLIN